MTGQMRTLKSATTERQRVLFIHGLYRKRYSQTGKMVANLLKRRLKSAEIIAEEDLVLKDGAHCPRYVVKLADNGCSWKDVEVTEVVYDDLIADHDNERSPFQRVLIQLFIAVSETWRLFRLIPNQVPEVTKRHKVWAFFFAAIIYFGLLGGLVSLVAMGVEVPGAICKIFDLQTPSSTAHWTCEIGESWNSTLRFALRVILVIATVMSGLSWFLTSRSSEKYEDDTRSAFAFIECQKKDSKLRSAIIDRVALALKTCVKANMIGKFQSLPIVKVRCC